MKKTATIACLFALAVLMGSARADIAFINLDNGGTAANNIGGQWKEALSFSINTTGINLTHADIYLDQISGSTPSALWVIVENNTGTPDNTITGEPIKGCIGTIPAFTVTAWKNVTFANCQLQPDRMYFLVLNISSEGDYYYSTFTNTSNILTNGNRWHRNSVPAWIDDGANEEFQIRMWNESVAPSFLNIVYPENRTYYSTSILLNVSNSTPINSFWFVINSTSFTYFSPWTTPNGTYEYPLNGVFNLTVYGNSSDGSIIYSDEEHFTIRSYQILANTWPGNTVETKLDNYFISVLDNTGTSTVVAKLFLNGTHISTPSAPASGNYWNFTTGTIPPYLQGNINQTNITGIWQVTVNGTLVDSVVTNYTFSYFVERLRFLKCASPMLNSTIKYAVLYEQDSSVKINVTDFDVAATAVYIDSGAREYSFELGGDYQFEFCIFPGHVGSYKMNTTVKYSNDTYDDRWYWVEGRNMKNTTTSQTLLMYDKALSITPVFSVLDLFQAPQSGVIVEAWRWFVGLNSYNLTAAGKTSNEGVVELPLKSDEQYIYKIYRGGRLLMSWGPDLLTAATTSKELYTESGSFSDLWDYYEKITGNCYNVSSNLVCNFNDGSGLAAMTSLWVSAFIDPLNNTKTLCITNSTAASGTLVCDFSGYENKTIQYTIYVTLVDGTKVIIINEFLITEAPLLSQGAMGVFAAFIIILSMGLIGLSMPQAGVSGSLVMGYIGVAVSWWFGLLVVPLGAVVGLGFAIAVVVYILTTRGYGL